MHGLRHLLFARRGAPRRLLGPEFAKRVAHPPTDGSLCHTYHRNSPPTPALSGSRRHRRGGHEVGQGASDAALAIAA